MAKSLTTWKAQTIGKKIDLDNQSFDCVDVSKHWIQYLSDKPWQTSAGWGNAKDIYANWSTTYLEKIPRGNAPRLGDIVVMGGSVGGGYGHTGVVIEIRGNDIVIAQQNTFTQQAVYTGVWGAYQSYIVGYLRPKVAFETGQTQALKPYQRKVSAGGVNYREAPNRTATVIKVFAEGEILDFKGFIKGESVNGNNVWFVGMHTGKYAHSSGFTDQGTHDLPDLTPAPSLQPYQRQVAGDVINYRKTPELKPDNVIKTFQPGEILDFDGWVNGANVDGISVWFRGKYTGGYAWAGGFTNRTTDGIPELKPQPPAPVLQTFKADLGVVSRVYPVHPSNYQVTDFPSRPSGVVLHDFGTDGRDTLGSSLNHFSRADTNSPHFVVSGDEIIQTVPLKYRAYHAGPKGNDKVGIEIDPDVDTNPRTADSVRRLLKALDLYYGYPLKRHKHPEFMATSCGDEIDLNLFQPEPTAPPVPEPEKPPAPTPPVPEPVNPLPPVEPVPVKPSYKSVEGILAIVTNVIGVLTIFFSSLVLPEGTPTAIVQGVAFITLALTNINLAIQRTKLKQTAIDKTTELKTEVQSANRT